MDILNNIGIKKILVLKPRILKLQNFIGVSDTEFCFFRKILSLSLLNEKNVIKMKESHKRYSVMFSDEDYLLMNSVNILYQ